MDKRLQMVKENIDLLNRQAWDHRVSDSGQAEVLSREAIELSKSIGYTNGQAQGLRTLGFACIRKSKHQEAQKCLEQSLELFISVQNLEGESDVYEYFGIIQRSHGNYETSLQNLFHSLELRQQTNYLEGEALSLYHLGVTYKYLGHFEKALDYFLQSLSIAQKHQFWIAESYSLNNVGLIYFDTGDYENALKYFEQSLILRRQQGDAWGEAGCLDNIGMVHFYRNAFPEAIDFCTRALNISREIDDKKGQGNALFHLAQIYHMVNETPRALEFYKTSMDIRCSIGDKKGEAEVNLLLAELVLKEENNPEKTDHALSILQKALDLGTDTKALDLLSRVHFLMYRIHKQSNHFEKAITFLEKYLDLEKQIHREAIEQKVLNLEITYRVEESLRELEMSKARNDELVALYEESKEQKREIESQKKLVEQSLRELSDTQAQLIQREKLASLGELTTGVAHEIQNPLNFVNNFSELSNELLEEMEVALQSGNHGEAMELARDIKQNLIKVVFHGQRADAIVKGMLQHARTSTGQKEFTDLNTLIDEHLRLSYQGLRVRDKSFSSVLQTDFDPTIGLVSVIPQDIGRVFLNLFSNSFHSLAEKKKSNPRHESLLQVMTCNRNDKVEIRVRDNGMGIPQKLLSKIYQPFFTTKPTGQGTGLGLSISYDVITKMHGGQIQVNTQEGSYAEFIISLPYDMNKLL